MAAPFQQLADVDGPEKWFDSSARQLSHRRPSPLPAEAHPHSVHTYPAPFLKDPSHTIHYQSPLPFTVPEGGSVGLYPETSSLLQYEAQSHAPPHPQYVSSYEGSGGPVNSAYHNEQVRQNLAADDWYVSVGLAEHAAIPFHAAEYSFNSPSTDYSPRSASSRPLPPPSLHHHHSEPHLRTLPLSPSGWPSSSSSSYAQEAHGIPYGHDSHHSVIHQPRHWNATSYGPTQLATARGPSSGVLFPHVSRQGDFDNHLAAPQSSFSGPPLPRQLQNGSHLQSDPVGNDEEAKHKREALMERNRLAAQRSRQRRKNLVESFEALASDYCAQNTTLQDEARALESELMHLCEIAKTHGGCSITTMNGGWSHSMEAMHRIHQEAGPALRLDYTGVPRFGTDHDVFVQDRRCLSIQSHEDDSENEGVGRGRGRSKRRRSN